MWLDNASNIDLLFYSPYADTIVIYISHISAMLMDIYDYKF